MTRANGTLVVAAGRAMHPLGAAIGSAGAATLQAVGNTNRDAHTAT